MKISLPKKTQKEIKYQIKKKKFEDVSLLKKIEKNILSKKNDLFIMPKAGSPVIVPFSGGIDSTVLIFILIKIYKLVVYPYYVADQKRSKNEIKTAKKTIKTIKSKFPKKIKKLKIYKNDNNNWAHKNKELNKDNRSLVNIIIDFRTYFSFAHAHYLEKTEGVRCRDIIYGINADDGDYNPSQTLTNTRMHQLDILVKTGEPEWQFTSLFIESTLDFYLTKSEIITIGKKLKVPIFNTWSCFKSYPIHCGYCGNCTIRKKDFNKIGIKDKTLYLSDIKKPRILFEKIVRIFRK